MCANTSEALREEVKKARERYQASGNGATSYVTPSILEKEPSLVDTGEFNDGDDCYYENVSPTSSRSAKDA